MFLFARILHGFFNGREEEENPKDVFACTVVQGRAGQDGGLDAVLPGERRPGARSDEGFFRVPVRDRVPLRVPVRDRVPLRVPLRVL